MHHDFQRRCRPSQSPCTTCIKQYLSYHRLLHDHTHTTLCLVVARLNNGVRNSGATGSIVMVSPVCWSCPMASSTPPASSLRRPLCPSSSAPAHSESASLCYTRQLTGLRRTKLRHHRRFSARYRQRRGRCVLPHSMPLPMRVTGVVRNSLALCPRLACLLHVDFSSWRNAGTSSSHRSSVRDVDSSMCCSYRRSASAWFGCRQHVGSVTCM